jgi:hypothetical protein
MKILLTVIIIMVSNLIIKTNLKSDKLLINQSSKKLNILIFLIKNIKDFIFLY